MRERSNTLITAGTATFPGGVWTPPVLLDYAADPTAPNDLFDPDEETDDVSTYTDRDGLYLAELDLVIGLEPDMTYSGSPAIVVSTGTGGGGTVFDIILDDASFGAASLRECRVHTGTGRLDFNVAQIADLGTGVVYVNYKASHFRMTASLQAARDAEMTALQEYSFGQSSLPTIAPSSPLFPGFGWIDGTGYAGAAGIRQLTDPTDKAQMEMAVWILFARSHGEDCPYRIRGTVTSPLALPFGLPILIGLNSMPTWLGDTSGNELTPGSSQFERFAGRRYSDTATELTLNLETPVGGEL